RAVAWGIGGEQCAAHADSTEAVADAATETAAGRAVRAGKGSRAGEPIGAAGRRAIGQSAIYQDEGGTIIDASADAVASVAPVAGIVLAGPAVAAGSTRNAIVVEGAVSDRRDGDIADSAAQAAA